MFFGFRDGLGKSIFNRVVRFWSDKFPGNVTIKWRKKRELTKECLCLKARCLLF